MARKRTVKKIYREKTIARIEKKAHLLGVNSDYDPIFIMNFRVISCLILFSYLMIVSSIGYITAPLATVGCWFLFEIIVLDRPIERRINRLNKEAIFFFEVLVLSLESGKDIEGSIEITVNNVSGELSDEFRKSMEEVKIGKSLNEALKDMSLRIPSDVINNVILNITQTSLFGNDIVDTLYNQIDYLRNKRLLYVKGNINKLPIKLSAVSVIFFVPIILIIILAPVIITLFG